MRGNLLTAVIALALVCSLTGCGESTAAHNSNIDSRGSTHSAMDRDGIHDGADVPQQGRQDDLLKDVPNWNEDFGNVDRDTVDHKVIPRIGARS